MGVSEGGGGREQVSRDLGEQVRGRCKSPEADLSASLLSSPMQSRGMQSSCCVRNLGHTGGRVRTEEWQDPTGFEWTPSGCYANNRLYVGKQPCQAAPVETQVRDSGPGPSWQPWRREAVAGG